MGVKDGKVGQPGPVQMSLDQVTTPATNDKEYTVDNMSINNQFDQNSVFGASQNPLSAQSKRYKPPGTAGGSPSNF